MRGIAKWITPIGFLSILFGIAIAFWISPDRAFSVEENRALATLPRMSLDALTSGEYSSDVNDYFSDQFPMRDFWVGQKGNAELLLGKGENNGILLGKDGRLAKRLFSVRTETGGVCESMDVVDQSHVASAMEGVNRLSNRLDIPFSVLFAGRNIDVAASSFAYPRENSDTLLRAVQGNLSPTLDVIDTVSMLRRHHDNGESVYYNTDHHWTTRGAYYAYREIMRAFGMEDEILDESYFQIESVDAPFYGSLWSAGGMKQVMPDHIEIWHAEDDGFYEVIADGKPLDGFYQTSHLDKKDHYSVFLDGVHDVVTISKRTDAARPVLLMIKDSYANSIAPFLARHFDLVLLNLSSTRKDFTNVSKLAKDWNADRVLLLYGLENVITADKLIRLQ